MKKLSWNNKETDCKERKDEGKGKGKGRTAWEEFLISAALGESQEQELD